MAQRVIFLSVLLLIGLSAAAFAQDYQPAQFDRHGFGVALPPGGELVRPDEPGWNNDEEIAFEWYGDPHTAPVALIQARVDDLGSEIDADTFRLFADALLGNWAAAPAGEAGADAGPYEVRNAADNLVINGRTWNLIEVADRTDPQTTVYYSVFSTYEGTRIYTVTLYYLQPDMEVVQDFGRPVLQGFNVL